MTESKVLEEQDPGYKSVAKQVEAKDTEKDGGYTSQFRPVQSC